MDSAQDYILETVRSALNEGHSVQTVMKWLAEIIVYISED
jgi:hypothetical protein